MPRSMVIVGASRGLGALMQTHLPQAGDTVWLVSRSEPDLSDADGARRIWIRADLADPDAPDEIAAQIADQRVDVVFYNAGIWESTGFSSAYDFESISDDETERLLTVNLRAPMTVIKRLLPNLRKSDNPKILLTGSISGLENATGQEVAYVASKFGLRGVAHALRHNLRADRIAVTCLNLGSFGNYAVRGGKVMINEDESVISAQDLISVVRCVLAMSNNTCIKEIDVFAMADALA